MSKLLPKPIQDLTEAFSALPGIGPKMATRLAIYIATRSVSQVGNTLSQAIDDTLTKVQVCKQCGNLSLNEVCDICQDSSRDSTRLLVVESAIDLIQVESTKEFNGRYIVLGGLISPLNGVGPRNLSIDKLEDMLQRYPQTEEITLALSATVEGEATSLYISNIVTSYSPKVRITRLAKGLPTGAEIEYMDIETLKGALKNRKSLD